jgi:DNA topoisomerase VI subunit A
MRYDVHVIAAGGYDSLMAKRAMAQLIAEAAVPFVILHIGDLDPHGQQIYSVVREDVAAFLADMGAQV